MSIRHAGIVITTAVEQTVYMSTFLPTGIFRFWVDNYSLLKQMIVGETLLNSLSNPTFPSSYSNKKLKQNILIFVFIVRFMQWNMLSHRLCKVETNKRNYICGNIFVVVYYESFEQGYFVLKFSYVVERFTDATMSWFTGIKC